MAVIILMISLSLWLSPVVQGNTFVQPGPPDVCLQGPFHKITPSPEEEEFQECRSWQNRSCCNIALSVSISRHRAMKLYNYSWDLCGVLSRECEEFIKVWHHALFVGNRSTVHQGLHWECMWYCCGDTQCSMLLSQTAIGSLVLHSQMCTQECVVMQECISIIHNYTVYLPGSLYHC